MILDYVKSLGHKVFTTGLYNLNIVGVRTPNGVPDAFDDWIVVAYQDGGGWVCRWWPITTDPGLYYLMSEDRQLNPNGTAILKEGQYRGVYKIDLHGSSQYEALCQRNGDVTVWRDNDHDNEIDYGVDPVTGSFGINIHASSMSPYSGSDSASEVGAWSGGCQVFQNESDFREFMALCKLQQKHHPTWDTYTYTLVSAPVAFQLR